MEKQEAVSKAVAKVYLTREQREKQTEEFKKILDKQRENGEVPGKPRYNDVKR